MTAADNGIKKLYHYQRFEPERLIDLVVNRRIHCSSPQTFNDPWDCRPWFDTRAASDIETRADLVRCLEPNIPKAHEELLKSQGIEWREHPEFLTQVVEKTTNSTWQINAERWRIYCLTPHPDSLLMWSHYAYGHRGICLEFDTGAPVIGSARQVMYQNTYRPILWSAIHTQDQLSTLLDKSWQWAYEDEYRILARDSTADNGPYPRISHDDYLSLPAGALSAVIAGCNADLPAIQSIVQKHAPQLRFRTCIRDCKNYGLSIHDCENS